MLKIIKGLEGSLRFLIGSEVANLPIGTTFLGRIGSIGNRTLGARIYSGIVNLENLYQTWTFPPGGSPDIADFQEVDIEAIIKEKK